jgi:hypothetical protein
MTDFWWGTVSKSIHIVKIKHLPLNSELYPMESAFCQFRTCPMQVASMMSGAGLSVISNSWNLKVKEVSFKMDWYFKPFDLRAKNYRHSKRTHSQKKIPVLPWKAASPAT